MSICILVAADEGGVIGKDNRLLWKQPKDLKRFKEMTLGYPVVMGRKTHESIGKPLPGRENIILTRNPNYKKEGCISAIGIENILQTYKNSETDHVFVVGGEEIYKLFLPHTSKIFLTRIHTTLSGDAFFSVPETEEYWKETKREFVPKDENHDYDMTFITYSLTQTI